jgi:uncharacterized OB-fold protein
MTAQIPLVDYLVLGEEPHLVAQECVGCGARYFERRNACAACGKQEFRSVRVADTGELRSFTIVSMAPPGVPTPFVAAIVDCDGTSVRGNLINVTPSPADVSLGMKLRLATYVVGTDAAGTEAVGYGFEPLESETAASRSGVAEGAI